MSLTPEQLEQRKGLLTASDAAAALGLSRWKTRHQLWSEKTGEGSVFSGNFRTRRGHAIEPLLLEWLGERVAPRHLKPAGAVTLTHPILPWLGATPDALIYPDAAATRPVAIGEAKSSSLVGDWTDEDGEPKVPDYYHPQIVVQMAVAGVASAEVVVELLDPREREPRIIHVERDEELQALVLNELDHFWRFVVTKTPPPFDDDSSYADVATVFRRVRRPELVRASEADDDLARRYLEATRQRKLFDEVAEKAKAELCARIADRQGIAGETWAATWAERAAAVVSYTRKGYRHFDLREKRNASP